LENLPAAILTRHHLVSRYQAIRNIHFPEHHHLLQEAIHRYKFEELFIHQIGICKLKLNRQLIEGYRFNKVGEQFNTFYKEHLPFELTDDQKKVLREIRLDTQTGHQMNRLLQGDVGSGKTIVALLSMLLAVDNGFQACLMAPTEILAQQHFVGIKDLLAPMQIEVGYLTGKVKAKERKIQAEKLESGAMKLLIGTHALIEDSVLIWDFASSMSSIALALHNARNFGKKIPYRLIFL
jgi:ATP-dependent DNA helicase RecG